MIKKEDVLNNLEEVKKYILEAENKKEEKVVGIAIKNKWTGSIIFQSTKTIYKDAVIEAKNSGADLRGADLRGADLSDTNLSGANLRDAELNCAKFYGRGGTINLTRTQLPGFLGALGFKLEE